MFGPGLGSGHKLLSYLGSGLWAQHMKYENTIQIILLDLKRTGMGQYGLIFGQNEAGDTQEAFQTPPDRWGPNISPKIGQTIKNQKSGKFPNSDETSSGLSHEPTPALGLENQQIQSAHPACRVEGVLDYFLILIT